MIHSLGAPTVSEFADFLGISRPGASYKVASLIQKGYIVKEASEDDKREFRLRLTEKYYNYIGLYEDGVREYVREVEGQFTPEQLLSFDGILTKVESKIDEAQPVTRPAEPQD